MTKFLISILLCSTTSLWAQGTTTVFKIKHMPSSKTVGQVEGAKCDDKVKLIGEFKDFNMKCLIVKQGQEQLKFFTLFDKDKEIATFKGTLTDKLKNAVTLEFRGAHIEVEF